MVYKNLKNMPKEEENKHVEIPAYLMLAEELKNKILNETYKTGEKIPSEATLAKKHKLALLTVRQALSVLVEQGILEKFPGRGSYVKELSWREASFSIESLVEIISDENAKARIIKTEVRKASEAIASKLAVSLGDSVVFLKRTLGLQRDIFLIQEGYLILDPFRPVVEAELEATYLSGLFAGRGQGLIKSADLSITPVILSAEDCLLLSKAQNTVGFSLEYTFYDALSKPLAWGTFITPENYIRLTTKIGIQ